MIVEGVNVSAAPIGECKSLLKSCFTLYLKNPIFTGKWRQLFFVYRLRSSEGGGTQASKNCPKGRGALLVFRCDPAGAASSMANAADKVATLTLPSACPDGTCDGCMYTLLLTSPHACPRCGRSDYKRIVGECRDGQQAIHYISNTK